MHSALIFPIPFIPVRSNSRIYRNKRDSGDMRRNISVWSLGFDVWSLRFNPEPGTWNAEPEALLRREFGV